MISDLLREWLDTTQFTELPSTTPMADGLPVAQPDSDDDDTSTD